MEDEQFKDLLQSVRDMGAHMRSTATNYRCQQCGEALPPIDSNETHSPNCKGKPALPLMDRLAILEAKVAALECLRKQTSPKRARS